MAAPWRARPARAVRARRSTSARGPNADAREHPAHHRAHTFIRVIEIAQRPSNAAPNGTAPSVQPCRRRRTASCRSARDPARVATSNRTRSPPTFTIAKSLCASALNLPPARHAAESSLLSPAAFRPRPWASVGPSACRPARAGRREARTPSPQTKQLLPLTGPTGRWRRRGFPKQTASIGPREYLFQNETLRSGHASIFGRYLQTGASVLHMKVRDLTSESLESERGG